MFNELVSLDVQELPIPASDPSMLEMLLQPRLALFWGSSTPTRALLAALTVLAARGHPIRVFDGGNRFDGYFIARLARRLNSDPHTTLERIRLSRAFTCFQLAELIENTPGAGGNAHNTPAWIDKPYPPDEAPENLPLLFVLDLLNTFYDESVPLRDSQRLLHNTIGHLKRLASQGPVIVGAREPRVLVKERWTLLDQLQVAADVAWLLRSPEGRDEVQPRLF
ncbi:MAG: hypothetical protein E4G99_02840 [Anaerolineales bacterium]|nr:MAG: hypothetical protein E4G99_02840 [Anaerolineales bacterium]